MVCEIASLQDRKQRWINFYDLANPRRLVVIVRYAPDLPPRPLPNPDLVEQRLEWIWRNYELNLERLSWLDDDSLPYLDMLTGTEIFAEAFGCRVQRPPDNNPFALPFVTTPAQADRLAVPSLDVPAVARVFAMADALQKRAGPGALFRMVDLQSPLDVAALIWEKTAFYTALVETPEAVAGLVEKITAFQFTFLDEWFRRYGREHVAHYPDYYMPSGVTLSVDEIGAISARMFRETCLPGLNQFSRRYGGLGMHCCAHARHQWPHFLDVTGLRLLNINQPEAVLREAYPFFAGFCAQWHYGWDPNPGNLDGWLASLPREGHVVVDITAASREEALQVCGRLRDFQEV